MNETKRPTRAEVMGRLGVPLRAGLTNRQEDDARAAELTAELFGGFAPEEPKKVEVPRLTGVDFCIDQGFNGCGTICYMGLTVTPEILNAIFARSDAWREIMDFLEAADLWSAPGEAKHRIGIALDLMKAPHMGIGPKR